MAFNWQILSPSSMFFHDLDVFASSEGANDRLRVPKACPECFSEFIHPGYSKSGLTGFHFAPSGSVCVALLSLSLRFESFRGAKLAGDR